jgi:hypothetical protein
MDHGGNSYKSNSCNGTENNNIKTSYDGQEV